ncbi:MAG: amidohydrolase [Clostridiales bacterium]|nr:amidohydrolase [Clostridiales bacterium]
MRNKEKLKKAIEFRHEIHRNPDLSGEERPTYERIQKFLAENAPSIEVVDKGVYIYGIYRSKHPERPRIGFRCDVDALPIEDKIDKPYRSCKPGIGHKCGHDGHTATMCALAMELDEFGAERDVYMIFQPSEENGAGAIQCTRFITDNNIAEFFGMHCSTDEDKGVVQYRDGLMNCASVGICVKYKGVSTHASLPELGKNPSAAIAKLALACDELSASEEYKDLVMATVIHMKSGEDGAYGIAANKGKFQVTLRAAIEAEMDDLESKLVAKAEELAEEYGLECKIVQSDRFPETVNDPAMNRKLLKVCKELGIPTAERPEAERGSEDFGHFAKLTPSTIYMMCMGKDKPHLHSVEFDFDDDIIDTAVDIHMGLINDI